MIINGEKRSGSASSSIINPATGNLIDTMVIASDKDINLAIETAKKGVETGRTMSRVERAEILSQAAGFVRSSSEEFAQTIVKESGKTIQQSRKEVARCVNTLLLSAEEAKRLTGEEIPFDSYAGSEERHGYFVREPVGIILAITPFNDPLNLVAHKVGPALAGGNAVILKPSFLTPLSALKLVNCLLKAGLPTEMLSVVTGDGAVGDALVRNKHVRMISFTGGNETGEAITKAAGLKRISMDLGGNAPVLVLRDANLEKSISACVSGAFWAAGQNCIGVQRIFVHQEIYPQFIEIFKTRTEALKHGDPMDDETDIGPMISIAQAERIEGWVNEAIDMGATLLTGNSRKDAYYSPTILTNVPSLAKLSSAEVFAPVAIIQPFTSLEEVIEEANKPDFLLHAGVFSNDMKSVQKIITSLKVGGVMINDSSDYRFDGMPFGGSKFGNMGREGVSHALHEMTQTKVICYNEYAA